MEGTEELLPKMEGAEALLANGEGKEEVLPKGEDPPKREVEAEEEDAAGVDDAKDGKEDACRVEEPKGEAPLEVLACC